RVDNMKQEISLNRLLKGCPESCDEGVRKVANKSHRVRNDQRATIPQKHFAGGGIQGGEQLISHISVRTGEAVEQSGFSRVCIAYNGHRGHIGALAGTALQS